MNAFQPTLNGSDAFVSKIGPSMELALSMTDSPDPVALGSNLTYNLTVTNNGELPATAVTLANTLPAGATLVSATPGQGSCTGTSTVVCTLGTLNAGANTTVTIVIQPPAVRTINNTATVTANEIDPLPNNNSASQTTQVDFADVSVSGATAYNKVAPGARVNYLFTVKNNSGGPAEVTLTDNLPAGTTFVSCSANGGVCGGSGENRTVTFSSLAVGQSALVVLVAMVNPSVAEGTVLSNTATVSSTFPDPNTGNNSATTEITVTATPLRQKTNGQVAFSSINGIFTVKADGSEAPVPFPGGSTAIFPRWSPDGTKMAFTVAKNSNTFPFSFTAIDVVNADGTGLITLANNVINTSFDDRSGFAWSPDGTRVAYVGSDRFIYLANADGSGFTKLPNSPSSVKDIDWAADGSRFVFSMGGEIHVMNTDGSNLIKLVPLGSNSDGPTRYAAPAWSPDMTKILFVQTSNNFSDIFVMNSDGTGIRRLLNADRTFGPAWSPDGTKLAFYQLTEVHAINFDGSNDIRLATNESCCNFPSISWQPIPTNTPLPPPGPPPPVFSISGRLTESVNGNPVFFGSLTLSGTRNATLFTKSDGTFSFVNLPAGGNYTITPSSVFFSFNPANRTFNNLAADQTDADFVGTFVPANITGRVTDNNGNPLAGIKITSAGGFPEGSTFTDSSGFYSFLNVQRFRNYFISPDPFIAFNFVPSSVFIQNLTESQVVNFVGTRRPTNVISGRVVEAVNGQGLGSIMINLAQEINAVTSTFTDSNGNFTFGDRPSGHQYSISIFPDSTFIFEPVVNAPNPFAQIVIPNLTTDQNLTFRGTRRNTVQFASSAVTVPEVNTSIEVSVTRTGDTSSAALVSYATADGTASQKSDFTAAFGTVRFGPGETNKSITILLTDDARVEGAESFTLTLDSPFGAQLGTTKVTTINITDNDTDPNVVNPIENSTFFVRQHYHDFLNREPDAAGLAFWVNEIESCGTDQACREIKRINVSAAFFLSIEFQEEGYLVYRTYKTAF
ncbi:MAG TPA: Calx-beta domain-containing protein, partial [Pyrinomonadaceae bacterium]|nr:Calx-beta domain-containing protein [Pyrinomonadaceae bacterium]